MLIPAHHLSPLWWLARVEPYRYRAAVVLIQVKVPLGQAGMMRALFAGGHPMRDAKIFVRPTYDSRHYLARADHYARDAEHEPDPVIRSALVKIERKCRQNAQAATPSEA